MKNISPGMRILAGFITGLVLGLLVRAVFGDGATAIAETYITPFGTVFLKLIQVVCIPLVFSSVISGVCSSKDLKSMGRVGIKTLAFFLCTSFAAAVIALLLANVLQPGNNIDAPVMGAAGSPARYEGAVSGLITIHPSDLFASLSSGSMLQIIFFALILGIGISMAGERAACIREIFGSLYKVMCSITNIIMLYAPFAVCAMMISAAAGSGAGILRQYWAVCFGIYAGCFLHILIVYFPVVSFFCRYDPKKFFKTCFPSLSVAFSTMSSNSALPATLDNSRELGVPGYIRSFIIPLGCTINMDGTALYQGMLAVFISNVYGIRLTAMQQLKVVLVASLSSFGAAGVPGAGMVILGTVLTASGLPVEGIALVAGLLPVLSPICTAVNVLGDSVAALFVAKTESRHIKERQ